MLRRHNPATDDQTDSPGYDPAVVEEIVADDRELRLMMAAGVRITSFACLDEGVQFLLPILEPHPHLGVTLGPPKEVEVIAETLALIERRDRPVEPVTAFKSDRRIDRAVELFRRRIEKILLRLAQFEIRVERDGERRRIFHLVGFRARSGAGGESETKGSQQQDSHDASIKGEEGIGVNRDARRASAVRVRRAMPLTFLRDFGPIRAGRLFA